MFGSWDGTGRCSEVPGKGGPSAHWSGPGLPPDGDLCPGLTPRTGNRRDDICTEVVGEAPYPFRLFPALRSAALPYSCARGSLTGDLTWRFLCLRFLYTSPRNLNPAPDQHHDRDIFVLAGTEWQHGNMDCCCPFWTMPVRPSCWRINQGHGGEWDLAEMLNRGRYVSL